MTQWPVVASQVERTAQATHGELTFTENLTKVFPNNKRVICQCPIVLEPHIVLNTRFFLLHHVSVLQHVQVNVLIKRTIKLVRAEQSMLYLVKDYVPFLPYREVFPRNRFQRSLIDTLVYGTFMNKEDISAFADRVNCVNRLYTCITSAILFNFLCILNEHRTMTI